MEDFPTLKIIQIEWPQEYQNKVKDTQDRELIFKK